MLESAIQQVQNDVQRLESLASAYAQGWSDTVSEKVFSEISSLASNADNLSSQLNTQAAILRGIKSELSQLAR